jgi:hypothetical protein
VEENEKFLKIIEKVESIEIILSDVLKKLENVMVNYGRAGSVLESLVLRFNERLTSIENEIKKLD